MTQRKLASIQSLLMARTIFCDESGFSGNNLFLDKDRYFVYASVAITTAAKPGRRLSCRPA